MVSEVPDDQEIRDAVTRLLPVGTPWVLIRDDTSLQDQVDDEERDQWACRVETLSAPGQSYLIDRALIEYARDIRKQNYAETGEQA